MKILQSNCKKQRNIRMILLGLMLVFSILCQDRTTSRQQSDYCDFESFSQPCVFIKYKQPVNGYTVKIMWFQYGEIGNALFRLEKNGKVHYLFVEKWSDKFLYDKYCNDNVKYPNDTIIELNYIPKLDSEKYLSDNSPFFFSDIDFDGKDEFIINRFKGGSKGSNAYDVYKVGMNEITLMSESPFTELENGHCEFSSINKTVTIHKHDGAYHYIRNTYQAKQYEIMNWDKPITQYKFELINSYIINNDEYKKYNRTGEKLQLIEKGQYKPNL